MLTSRTRVWSDHQLPGSALDAASGWTQVDLVVIAASLGGPQPIRDIVGALPAWFPAAVLVVLHRTEAAQHLTVELLRRSTILNVELARENTRPMPGSVYVLPVDRQLSIGSDGEFLDGHIAATAPIRADPVIASVARHFGERAVGVILSGSNDDGAAGVVALKRAGGSIVAQNRRTARCFAMPAAAIATGCVDLVLPFDRIAYALVSFCGWPGAASLLRSPIAPWAILD
jgi:two-component system chemotaxis response regulator CheB